MDPAFGSGSQVDGIGLVFILGMGIIVLGIAIMIAMALTRPAFFRGETLSRGVSDGTESSEERRVGKTVVRQCSSRWSPYHYTQNTNNFNTLHTPTLSPTIST